MLKATHPPNDTKVLTSCTPKTFLEQASKEFEASRVVDLDTAFLAFRAALYLWLAMPGELLGEGT